MSINNLKKVFQIKLWLEQVKNNIVAIITILLVLTTFFGVVSLYCYKNGISLSLYIRDMAAVAHISPLISIISNTGLFMWGGTISIILFTYVALRDQLFYEEKLFLIFASLLNSILFLDDALMFHEYILPKFCGISEKYVMIFYALCSILFLLRFSSLILKFNYLLLFLGLAGMGSSVFIDMMPQFIPFQQTFEDYFKFIGIAMWCFFFINTSFEILKNKTINCNNLRSRHE
jgi:hypothetical protein